VDKATPIAIEHTQDDHDDQQYVDGVHGHVE